MVKLKNDRLEIDIANHGAEVKRVYHLDYELDYLWNSNPEFWARSSPVLFPDCWPSRRRYVFIKWKTIFIDATWICWR